MRPRVGEHREFAFASGEMSQTQFTMFLSETLRNISRVIRNGAIAFVCMDWRHVGELLAAGEASFTEFKNLVIWNKTNGGMGAFHRSKHELIPRCSSDRAVRTKVAASTAEGRSIICSRTASIAGSSFIKGEAYVGEHEPIVDEELWDAVQARLAGNASGSSRRLKHQHPSLLIGKVFDGEGRAMTPSHATKSNRRYRYYVTRTDQLDSSRAWRVSGHDLEQLVCSKIAEKLTEQQFIVPFLGEVGREELQKALADADLTGATLRSGKAHDRAELLTRIVDRVDFTTIAST